MPRKDDLSEAEKKLLARYPEAVKMVIPRRPSNAPIFTGSYNKDHR